MSEAKDETFASCMMGGGVVIRPEEDTIVAPCNGTVTLCSEDNKHAIGLQSDTGLELLIHVGVDTVSLKGKGFKLLKQQDSPMKTGEPLLRFDRKYIEAQGLCTDVMLILVGTKENEAQFFTGIPAKAGETLVAKM